MPATVSEVRTILLEDPSGTSLSLPKTLNAATDTIPYGARVRFEVEVTADEPLHPLSIGVTTPGTAQGLTLHLPHSGGSTYSREVRLPWGLRGAGEYVGVASAPTLPTDGWPDLAGGAYTLHIKPWPTTAGSAAEEWASSDYTFQLGSRPSGGSAPQIVSLNSNLANNRVLRGQPWTPSAQVTDADGDLLAVVFSVYIGGLYRWWFMFNDGRFGSSVSADTFSFLRVGGDFFDRPETGWGHDLDAVFSVQAVDLAGNWSQPSRFTYTVVNSERPIWIREPDPKGPALTQAQVTTADAPPASYRLTANCSSPDSLVFALTRDSKPEVFPLFSTDCWSGAPLAAGTFSNLYWIPFNHPRWYRDIVLYGVSRADTSKIGPRAAVNLAPIE